MAKDNMFNLMKRINKESKKAKKYNTGLIGENLIVASYKQMPLDKLEGMRIILNDVIRTKKIFKKVAKAQETAE